MDPEPPSLHILIFFSFLLINYWGIAISVLVLCLLLCCSALISGSEVAFFSLSPNEVENLQNDDSGKLINKLRSRPRKLLATILIANNFINIAIVILSDFLVRNILPQDSLLLFCEGLSFLPFGAASCAMVINFLITIVGVTFLLVLFGEVAPKIYANLNNVKFAKVMSSPLNILMKAFSPLSALLVSWSTKMESRFIYKKSGLDDANKEELDRAIELTVDKDTDGEEADILKGIIKFGNVSTKQIMKSRVDVVALDITAGFKEVMSTIKESGYSRLPVYKDDFDSLQGILYVKDLLGHSKENDGFSWQQSIRDNLLYVPESKKIDDLLREFQLKRTHMGIVVDEFGGSAGIVTLEDIMEEVIGEIKDEFDEEEEVDYIKINKDNYIFEGKSLLNDVARIIGEESDVFDNFRGQSDSLAGMLLEKLGHLPKKDREISLNNFKFRIVSVSKRRIEKIHLTIT